MTTENTTHSAKKGEVERNWFVVDATDLTLGRVATRIASVLRGKHKATFTPHVDAGDFVIVVNAEKIQLTGRKMDRKLYYWHSEYPGGLKTRTARQMISGKPEEVFRRAVWGMLPKNRLSRQLITKLKVYSGPTHPHQAQRPEMLSM